ncbi:thioredoxin family protein [Holdemania massiliensis]|uniref:thioredoxin family protein n=1 Tax=Holdemania massiliensis TaxID=1468449 RepID=UPI0023DD138C|nr:thioredoxin family protein [Holdemania massiliensis]
MKLFGKKTCCSGNYTSEAMAKAENTKSNTGIKILGSGCAKCQALEKAVRIALKELEFDLELEHVTDFAAIASYGVMSTPALVVNGKVVSYGKVLSVEQIKTLLK